MTAQAPITREAAITLRLDEYYDYLRAHHPRKYAKHLREQAQVDEMQHFFASAAGKSVMAEVEAFITPEQVNAAVQTRAAGRNRAAYTLLGVQPGATQAQIKKAYRQKARELHPDKGGSEVAMKKLNTAYQKLTTAKK